MHNVLFEYPKSERTYIEAAIYATAIMDRARQTATDLEQSKRIGQKFSDAMGAVIAEEMKDGGPMKYASAMYGIIFAASEQFAVLSLMLPSVNKQSARSSMLIAQAAGMFLTDMIRVGFAIPDEQWRAFNDQQLPDPIEAMVNDLFGGAGKYQCNCAACRAKRELEAKGGVEVISGKGMDSLTEVLSKLTGAQSKGDFDTVLKELVDKAQSSTTFGRGRPDMKDAEEGLVDPGMSLKDATSSLLEGARTSEQLYEAFRKSFIALPPAAMDDVNDVSEKIAALLNAPTKDGRTRSRAEHMTIAGHIYAAALANCNEDTGVRGYARVVAASMGPFVTRVLRETWDEIAKQDKAEAGQKAEG